MTTASENILRGLTAADMKAFTGRDIALLYADGKALADEDIARLRELNGEAWFACVDPAERARVRREHILQEARTAEAETKLQAAAAPKPTIRAEYPQAKASGDIRESTKPATARMVFKLLDLFKNRDREVAEAFGVLERRIEALEARGSGLSYEGIWTSTRSYAKGDVVTYSGSMWACRAASGTTTAKPGASVDWQLCVKAGRDYRPGRPERHNDGDER